VAHGEPPHLSTVDSLLALGLAIVCAFSQQDCRTAQSLPVRQGDTWLPADAPVSAASGPGTSTYKVLAAAYTLWAGRSPRYIVVSDQLTHPAAIAAVLAHEAAEIQRGYPPHGKDCDGYEGWAEQQALFAWFNATFGPPVAQPGSLDTRVFFTSIPGQQPRTPC
jgi:hypothetical protein